MPVKSIAPRILRRRNIWWISFDLDGRQIRESAHTTDEAVARNLLDMRLTECGLKVQLQPVAAQAVLDSEAQWDAALRHHSAQCLEVNGSKAQANRTCLCGLKTWEGSE